MRKDKFVSSICFVLFDLILITSGAFIDRSRGGLSVGSSVRCPEPSLKNGGVIFRKKMANFKCMRGFTMIGAQHSGCMNGKWDTPIPVCAKKGCRQPEKPTNGFFVLENNNLQLFLFCSEEYQVAGNRVAYCDGDKWDRQFGNCRKTIKKTQTACDFETDDLCGWLHDDQSDFEWKRLPAFDAASTHTGPKIDHTYHEMGKGHYMLIESTISNRNEQARLVSPLYDAKLSRDACFSFYYYMYGAGVGTLRVYVKPFSIDMDTMIVEESRYLFFNRSGNQRNYWHNANINIDQYNESFQIIIEGTAGSTGRLSDIAIDDIAIFQGSLGCAREQFSTNTEAVSIRTTPLRSVSEIIVDRTIFDYQSCKDRCNETESTKFRDRIVTKNDEIIKSCDCYADCEESCCPDYANFCVFGTSDQQDFITTTISSTLVKRKTTTFQISSTTLTTTTNKLFMLQDEPSKDENEESIEWNYLQRSVTETGSDPGPLPIIIIIVSIISICMILTIIFIGTKWYRKNYGPENYRKDVERRNQNQKSEEFSDVRYLAEEEQLDFTIQTSTILNPDHVTIEHKACPESSTL